MGCPDEGLLLLWLEGELEMKQVSAIEGHLASCSACRRRLDALREDRELLFRVGRQVEGDLEASATASDKVWVRVEPHLNRKGDGMIMRLKKAAIAAAVILAIVCLMSVPSVKTAAAGFLQVFRVENLATITITPQDLSQIEAAIQNGDGRFDSESFGRIETIGESSEQAITPAQLKELPYAVKVPANLESAAISVVHVPDVKLTLNVKNVNKAIESLGGKVLLPESIDGKTVRFSMADAVKISQGDMELYQGPSPQIDVPDDVDVNEVREALLALPVWPDNVKRQLEGIRDWNKTLIIPSVDNSAREVTVGTHRGILMDNGSPTLLWQDGDLICVLTSHSPNVTGETLINTAESLR